MASDEDTPQNQPTSPDDDRRFNRLVSVSLGVGSGRSMEDAGNVVRVVSELLHCPVRHVDENGYQHEITAGAVHPGSKAVAWVHCKSKTLANGHVDIEFRLKAQADGRPLIDWIVETYNPYFGCHVEYLAWHDRRVVMVYREKHHTYACSHPLTGGQQRVQLTKEWLVTESQITCRSQEPDLVDRFALPDLRRLPAMSADEARKAGTLPPEYDRWNEWHKRYALERRHPSEETIRSEQEWFSCGQPQKMLTYLRGKASERKLRLFDVACCRRIWGELRDERSRRAIEIAEEYAEGRSDKRTLNQARQDARTAHGAAQQVVSDIPRTAVNLASWTAAYTAAEAANAAQQIAAEDAFQATAAVADTTAFASSGDEAGTEEQAMQAVLLRDVFGNPFRPVAISSSWLTPTVLGVAASIYEQGAFDRMPVLADGLEEAGCNDAVILDHCRGTGPHVRGCWLLDSLLKKQ